MTRWILIVGLVLSGGVALANNQNEMNQQQKEGAQMLLPSGAKLVGAASATEVRTFPELNKVKEATTPDLVGARAVDRVYETNQSYRSAVNHIDKMVKQDQAEQLQRTTTRTATGWSLKMPDGTVHNIIVRNTKPTTIETVQAVGTAVEVTPMQNQNGMKKGEGTTPGQMNQPSPGQMNQPSPSQPSPNQPSQMNQMNQPSPNQLNEGGSIENPSGTTPSPDDTAGGQNR